MGIRHSHSRNSGYRLPLFQTLADVWVYTLNVRPIPIYYEENVYHLPRNFAQHIAYYAAHPSPAFHLQGRPLRNGTRRPRIHMLTQGFSEMDIARISGMCQQKVNRLKNALRYRASSLFARTLAEELRATPN